MKDFIFKLLVISCMNTFLFFVLMLLCKSFRRFIAPSGKYYSELIVICGFFYPFLSLLPFLNKINIIDLDLGSREITCYSEVYLPDIVPHSILLQENNLLIECAEKIFIIWIVGVGLFALLGGIRYFKVLRILEKQMVPLRDKVILKVYHSVCSRLNIYICPALFNNLYIKTPVLIKLRGDKIILPSECFFDKKALELVFYHELIHYKRKDIWIKIILDIVSILHWFNPLFILIKKEVDKTCELSCDEMVLKAIIETDKVKYGDLIIQTAKYSCSSDSNFLSFAKNNRDKKLVKERITWIMERKDEVLMKKIFAQVAVWTIIGGLGLSVTMAVSYAETNIDINSLSNTEKTLPEEINIVKDKVQKDVENKVCEIKIESFNKTYLTQEEFKDYVLDMVLIGSNDPTVKKNIISEIYNCSGWINCDEIIWIAPSERNDCDIKEGTITLIFK